MPDATPTDHLARLQNLAEVAEKYANAVIRHFVFDRRDAAALRWLLAEHAARQAAVAKITDDELDAMLRYDDDLSVGEELSAKHECLAKLVAAYRALSCPAPPPAAVDVEKVMVCVKAYAAIEQNVYYWRERHNSEQVDANERKLVEIEEQIRSLLGGQDHP